MQVESDIPAESTTLKDENPREDFAAEKQIINGEEVQLWWWNVSVSKSQIDAIRREDTRHRAHLAVEERSSTAHDRMVLMRNATALCVLALAGIWLFLRMERFAAYAGRTWTRMSIAGFVLAAGAILLLLMGVSKSASIGSHGKTPQNIQFR